MPQDAPGARGVKVTKLALAIRSIWATAGISLASLSASAQTPAPPPAGFALALTIGSGWSSNPLELPGRRKGDGYAGLEAVASHRWNLWTGGALNIAVSGYSELYFRDDSAGLNRAGLAATFSQRWQEMTFTLGASTRTAINQRMTAHDSASTDFSLGVSRSFTLIEDVTLTLTSGASRRLYQDGTEDQIRARIGATLSRKWEKWTFRIGGGFSYALEDKTPFLPRINDRTISTSIGATYEWAKDREVSAKLTYARTYSSLPINRFQTFGFVPQMAATLRF